MISKLYAALSTWWKWTAIVAVVAAVGYRVGFASIPVVTEPVVVGEVLSEVMGTGTLEAHHQTAVGSRIQGLIVELLVDQNDWVKSGQLLARLDDSDLSREVTAQEAVVESAAATVERTRADESRAKAVLEQARLDHDRYSGLMKSKSISQEQMDKTSQNLAVAEAELARASAAIVEVRRQQVAARERLHFQQARLADTRITSPYDGVIIRRDREVGDVVVPGTGIFVLVSTKELWISAWVDESAMSALAPGQPARVVYRSEPQNHYSGKVARISREVDRETREFRVDVGVIALPANWGIGQRAEVYIETGRRSGAVTVPVRAVVRRKLTPGVYVVNDGRAHWKEVSLGMRGIHQVEITKGLSGNEMVIIDPDSSELTDGQKVGTR